MPSVADKQRDVRRGVSRALGLSAAGLLLGIWLPLGHVPPGPLLGAVLLVPALALTAAIGHLARHRFVSEPDIDGSGLSQGSAAAQIGQAVLQNTLEQAVLAALVWSAWIALMPQGRFGPVVLAAVLFAVGRVLFWRGYARGAPGRAMGFGLTFYPSVALLALLVLTTLGRLLAALT